jgi:hypothetical protein
MKTVSLALSSPGTEVEPMWSMRSARSPRIDRILRASRWNSC